MFVFFFFCGLCGVTVTVGIFPHHWLTRVKIQSRTMKFRTVRIEGILTEGRARLSGGNLGTQGDIDPVGDLARWWSDTFHNFLTPTHTRIQKRTFFLNTLGKGG